MLWASFVKIWKITNCVVLLPDDSNSMSNVSLTELLIFSSVILGFVLSFLLIVIVIFLSKA